MKTNVVFQVELTSLLPKNLPCGYNLVLIVIRRDIMLVRKAKIPSFV